MASIKPEFDRRNVKIIGLSVDAAEDHAAWARDIEASDPARAALPQAGRLRAKAWISKFWRGQEPLARYRNAEVALRADFSSSSGLLGRQNFPIPPNHARLRFLRVPQVIPSEPKIGE
jgi:hypothetical protein